jgi:mannose-6-phosphate isomerase-like protein (cupin superfamily)
MGGDEAGCRRGSCQPAAGKVEHPKAGEELLIPAGAVHSARNVGKTTARWLYGYKRPG